MSTYVGFDASNGSKLLIEIENPALQAETIDPDLAGKATGVPAVVERAIASGSELFESAIKTVTQLHATAFYAALLTLPRPPTEATVEFGIKASAELGNFVVSKMAGEANYTIKLTWKLLTNSTESK
jgi:hypothetical protein